MMNFFYDLPDDIQEKIYRCAHEMKLKKTFPFIQCKPNPYKSIIYKTFCEASYDREDLKHFNNFLDYIHGKAYGFPWETERENKYLNMMVDLLITYH